MRQPVRKRNISLFITLASACSMAAALLLPLQVLDNITKATLVVISMCTGTFGLLYVIHFGQAAWAYQRLMEGRGLLAQWIVDPHTWRDFVVYDAQMSRGEVKYKNALKLTANPDVDGVEVILGETCLIVDGDYRPLPTKRNQSWFDALSLWLEPSLHVSLSLASNRAEGRGAPRKYYKLRFPLAVDAIDDADAALKVYDSRNKAILWRPVPLSKRRPGMVRNIALIVIIPAAICLVVGYIGGQKQLLDPDFATTLTSTGSILLVASVLSAIICQLTILKQHKEELIKPVPCAEKFHAHNA